MAGYCGYSMSNNAVEAYENGQRPLSRWTKGKILNSVKHLLADDPKLDVKLQLLKKFTVKNLKEYLLTDCGWHHTSMYYNETEFWEIDEDKLHELTISDIELALNEKAKSKPKKDIAVGVISVQEWGGTRNHPRFLGNSNYIGVVDGDWCFTDRGRFKISANKTNWTKSFNSFEEAVKEFPEFEGSSEKIKNILKVREKIK